MATPQIPPMPDVPDVVASTPFTAFAGRDVAQTVVFSVLAVAATVMRLVSRKVTRVGIKLDDWFAILALITFLAFMGIHAWGGYIADGYDLLEVPLPVLEQYLWMSYHSEWLTPLCITFVKLSILAFYDRLFGVHQTFRRWTIGVGVVCILWWIGATLGLLLQCMPVKAAWQPWLPEAKCFNFGGYVVGVEIPNAILDFIMIAMPIRLINTLQLKTRLRVAVSIIFFIGASVGIVGLIRIAIIYRPGALDSALLGELIALQLLLAVLCANFPTLRPLLPNNETFAKAMQKAGTSLRTMFRSSTQRSSKASLKDDDSTELVPASGHQFVKLTPQKSTHVTTIEASRAGETTPPARHTPGQNGIHVRNDVEMLNETTTNGSRL